MTIYLDNNVLKQILPKPTRKEFKHYLDIFKPYQPPDEMTCPECKGTAYCEAVDIGVGFQQVTPFQCQCGWEETKQEDI